MSSKTGGVNRAAELLPKQMNRTDVVLVGMGCDEPNQFVAMLNNELGIGHLYFVATLTLFKRYATIHHEPVTIVAKEIQVHANFAATAER
jgi:hypothetical protein